MVYKRQTYLAKVKGFHYWSPKFNSKDSAFVFALELFVLFVSLKQEMEQDMDNSSSFRFGFGTWLKAKDFFYILPKNFQGLYILPKNFQGPT